MAALCYQSAWGRQICWKCGAWPSPVHIPTRQVGYYCERCCPGCRPLSPCLPVETPAEYVFPGFCGKAYTFAIGSEDIILKPDRALNVGTPLELLIEWPAWRYRTLHLRLLVRGVVITRRGDTATVRSIGHQFQMGNGHVAPISS